MVLTPVSTGIISLVGYWMTTTHKQNDIIGNNVSRLEALETVTLSPNG